MGTVGTRQAYREAGRGDLPSQPHWTTMTPVIPGWMVHSNVYWPASVNVTSNASSGCSDRSAQTFVPDLTLCSTGEPFRNVTVPPTAMLPLCGMKRGGGADPVVTVMASGAPGPGPAGGSSLPQPAANPSVSASKPMSFMVTSEGGGIRKSSRGTFIPARNRCRRGKRADGRTGGVADGRGGIGKKKRAHGQVRPSCQSASPLVRLSAYHR